MEATRFTGSWDDIASQAEKAYGRIGRAVAVLTRAMGAGSKRIIASYIEEAAVLEGRGNTTPSILEWAGQPYSSSGLIAAAEMYRMWLAESNHIPLERF